MKYKHIDTILLQTVMRGKMIWNSGDKKALIYRYTRYLIPWIVVMEHIFAFSIFYASIQNKIDISKQNEGREIHIRRPSTLTLNFNQ